VKYIKVFVRGANDGLEPGLQVRRRPFGPPPHLLYAILYP